MLILSDQGAAAGSYALVQMLCATLPVCCNTAYSGHVVPSTCRFLTELVSIGCWCLGLAEQKLLHTKHVTELKPVLDLLQSSGYTSLSPKA